MNLQASPRILVLECCILVFGCIIFLMMCIPVVEAYPVVPSVCHRASFYRSSMSQSSSTPLVTRSMTKQIVTDSDDGYDGLGEYDPSEGLRPEREVVVGDPQIRLKEKERSVTSILKELAAIQQQGPQKYCILGTRHCSYLHQQIIELLYVVLYLSLIHI